MKDERRREGGARGGSHGCWQKICGWRRRRRREWLAAMLIAKPPLMQICCTREGKARQGRKERNERKKERKKTSLEASKQDELPNIICKQRL